LPGWEAKASSTKMLPIKLAKLAQPKTGGPA